MSGFKRFWRVVYAVAGILALAALAAPWFGIWTREAASLLSLDWYYGAVEALAAVLAVGLLATLTGALVAPRNDAIVVRRLDGGQVTVTRDAIASQVAHIVEADGSCLADGVVVRARKSGHIRVAVKVLPYSTVDVMGRGPEMHDRLMTGLAALCGDKLDRVSLEFLEPQTAADVMPVATGDAGVPAAGAGEAPAAVAVPDGPAVGKGPDEAGDPVVTNLEAAPSDEGED